MSGWTVATLRGAPSSDYEKARYDSTDPWDATADIVSTAENDKRVRAWEADCPHVYLYLNCERYDFEFAEEFMGDYKPMLRDAVVLGANDTTDTGTARYYPTPERHTDEYKETQSEDGTHVGYMALQIIGGRHGILARDPFHDWTGKLNENLLDDGVDQA